MMIPSRLVTEPSLWISSTSTCDEALPKSVLIIAAILMNTDEGKTPPENSAITEILSVANGEQGPHANGSKLQP